MRRRNASRAEQGQRELGPDHPNTGTLLNNLSRLSHAQGRYAEAEPLLKRALAIWEKALGPDHPNFAQSLNRVSPDRGESNRLGDRPIKKSPLKKAIKIAYWPGSLTFPRSMEDDD